MQRRRCVGRDGRQGGAFFPAVDGPHPSNLGNLRLAFGLGRFEMADHTGKCSDRGNYRKGADQSGDLAKQIRASPKNGATLSGLFARSVPPLRDGKIPEKFASLEAACCEKATRHVDENQRVKLMRRDLSRISSRGPSRCQANNLPAAPNRYVPATHVPLL